jgi:hypothetical protein
LKFEELPLKDKILVTPSPSDEEKPLPFDEDSLFFSRFLEREREKAPHQEKNEVEIASSFFFS